MAGEVVAAKSETRTIQGNHYLCNAKPVAGLPAFINTKTTLAPTLVPHMNPRQPKTDTPTLKWKWSYETPKDSNGLKIKARGKFITDTDRDGDGYVNIVGIKGKRNGEKITGLFPAGTSIPGNSPYAGAI